MKTLDLLLQWQYLIFLLPLALSAFLLILSSVRIGHSGGHGARGSMTPAHSHGAPHTSATVQSGHAAATHGGPVPTQHAQGMQGHLKLHIGPKGEHGKSAQAQNRSGISPAQALMSLLGIGRAPLMLILEVFFLSWGFTGYLANQVRALGTDPTPNRVLPSLAIALIGGVLGARLAATLLTRLMPAEESLIVSRDGLYGMTGNVAFPVSATSGRIHIYDQHGTLHDEMCRVSPDHPAIEKGRRALVVDRDAQGHLVVEEVPGV